MSRRPSKDHRRPILPGQVEEVVLGAARQFSEGHYWTIARCWASGEPRLQGRPVEEPTRIVQRFPGSDHLFRLPLLSAAATRCKGRSGKFRSDLEEVASAWTLRM